MSDCCGTEYDEYAPLILRLTAQRIDRLRAENASLRAQLVAQVQEARTQALGWMLAEACLSLDAGHDIRHADQAELLARALADLPDAPEVKS